MIETDYAYLMDYMEGMKQITDGSVDAIIVDLPYGVLNRSNPSVNWDYQIPLAALREQYRRITKPDSPVILLEQGFFSAWLMLPQPRLRRYNLVRQKDRVAGHLNAKRTLFWQHEDILVFYKKQPVYHPQVTLCPPEWKDHGRHRTEGFANRCHGAMKLSSVRIADNKYPTSVIFIPRRHKKSALYHPTQRSVVLVEYLIRTYTDEGNVVLDNCIESGTAAVVTIRTGRRHIGSEIEQVYCEVAGRQIQEELEYRDKVRGEKEIREEKQDQQANGVDKKGIAAAFFLAAGLLRAPNIQTQQTYEEMGQLTVNEQVTTVATTPEPVRSMDISTGKIVGDQPMGNIVYLRPKEGGYEDGEVLTIVAIVTERYRTQYALLYTTWIRGMVTDKETQLQERSAYHSPAILMSIVDIIRFARYIWNPSAKIRNVIAKAHRMTMRLNNIYSVGEYFFISFSIEDRTNIRFDIDEIWVKLIDKKLTKAINAQATELTPALMLKTDKTFRHGYQGVVVVKKVTFSNDKMLIIEMTEKQISGRNISPNIGYEGVLSADSFSAVLLEEE